MNHHREREARPSRGQKPFPHIQKLFFNAIQVPAQFLCQFALLDLLAQV